MAGWKKVLRITPQAMPDAPAATAVLSSTSTCSPRCARCHAVERPWTPAPITSTEVEEGTGSLMEGSLVAGESNLTIAHWAIPLLYIIHRFSPTRRRLE